MTSPNPWNEVLKGQPLEVDVARVEDQLRELWKGTAEEQAPDEEFVKPVVRTSVLNLVVYNEEATESQTISEAIGELTLQNPCRAIVVTAEPQSESSKIEAWISAHCQRPSPTNTVVCCEQISLQASGQAVRQLAPTAVSFFISDLPVFLWWRNGGLFESEFLRGISGVCDRLILDSKRFASPQADFPKLQNYIEAHRRQMAVSDVAWHRLMQWRELAAQFFDAPVFRSHLANLERVLIEFHQRADDRSSVPPQAYLLAGWMASRLRWNLTRAQSRNGGLDFQFVPGEGSRPIVIEIRPTEVLRELAGHLVSFEMTTSAPWSTTFRIHKGESPTLAQTEIAFANMPPFRRVVPLRIYNEFELIARQLEIFGHDTVFEDSVAMASRLVSALQ